MSRAGHCREGRKEVNSISALDTTLGQLWVPGGRGVVMSAPLCLDRGCLPSWKRLKCPWRLSKPSQIAGAEGGVLPVTLDLSRSSCSCTSPPPRSNHCILSARPLLGQELRHCGKLLLRPLFLPHTLVSREVAATPPHPPATGKERHRLFGKTLSNSRGRSE